MPPKSDIKVEPYGQTDKIHSNIQKEKYAQKTKLNPTYKRTKQL